MFSAIIAVAQNGVIGKNNALPWHLPADLKHFKNITMGKPIIMGRKTFASIGKPLPGRTNIVVTRDQTFSANGVVVKHSLEDAISAANTLAEEFFLIGGAELFAQARDKIDRIYLTRIHKNFDGDVKLADNFLDGFTEVKREDHFEPYPFSFMTFVKS